MESINLNHTNGKTKMLCTLYKYVCNKYF